MERKIGEIFELDGEWYQCIENDSCGECSLFTTECRTGTKSDLADKVVGQCSKVRRIDNKHAIFKKLEKVGEHYINNGRTYQLYKLPLNIEKLPSHTEGITLVRFDIVEIEIKQNKEDMEEKKLNLKPFDIQKAIEGKPVCTRDGRKARVICFDRVTNSTNEYTGHLIVLVTNPNGDEQSFYYTEKGNLAGEDEYDNQKWDLMMLPKKKEGWVNVYKDSVYDTKDEAIDATYEGRGYIDTVKINWEE